MTLRPYQTRIVDSVLRSLGEVRRTLVVAPTGSGKTICFAHLCDRVAHFHKPFENTSGKTLVLVNREQLLQQAADKIHKAVGMKASIERGEDRADLHAAVVVATVQSMVRRLGKYDPCHFGLVVCDEAHLFTGDQAQKVFAHFSPAKLVGFTATPNTKGKRALINFYDSIACEIPLMELIQAGYLAKLKLAMMPLNIDLSNVRVKAGDFVDEDLDEAVVPHFSAVIQQMLNFPTRKWIVFTPLIKSSKLFASMLEAQGVKSLHLDGTSDDIQEKLKDFATWHNGAVTCSQLLSFGYDEPSLTGIVNLRPTKSEIFYMQSVGRITRIHPGKEDALILDPLFLGYKHKVIRPAFLLAKSEEEAEGMERAMKKGGMSDLMDMHAAMKRELEENMRKKARKMDIFMMSLLGDDPIEREVLEYEPVFPWESQPPTIPQVMSLENAGITRAMIRDKGHASKLFDLLKSRRERNLASVKQCKLLSKLYVAHDPTTLLFDDARKMIDEALHAKRGSNYTTRERWKLPSQKFFPAI